MSKASLLLGLLGIVPALRVPAPLPDPTGEGEAKQGRRGCLECHSSSHEGPKRGGCNRPALTLPDPKEKGFEWEAFIRSGLRFVEQNGSRNRFDTDLNLDDGVRLADFELTGRFLNPNPYMGQFSVDARSIGDPYQSLRGRIKHQHSQAVLHGPVGIRSARAPGIQWV